MCLSTKTKKMFWKSIYLWLASVSNRRNTLLCEWITCRNWKVLYMWPIWILYHYTLSTNNLFWWYSHEYYYKKIFAYTKWVSYIAKYYKFAFKIGSKSMLLVNRSGAVVNEIHEGATRSLTPGVAPTVLRYATMYTRLWLRIICVW